MATGLMELLAGCAYLVMDFDGVLADSEPLFRRSWNRALATVGHSVSEEDYWLYWSSLGQGLEGEASRSGLGLTADDMERLRDLQRATYSAYCRSGIVPLADGAKELMELLNRQRCGLQGWAIASNTESGLVREVLRHGGAPEPKLLVGGEGLRRKPAPDIFRRAAELLEAAPADCLVVEDSAKGISAARAGGFPVVRVLNGQNRFHRSKALMDLDGLQPLLSDLARRDGLLNA
jgi:HAD superfamily hydrolase (TIGR01509 family)